MHDCSVTYISSPLVQRQRWNHWYRSNYHSSCMNCCHHRYHRSHQNQIVHHHYSSPHIHDHIATRTAAFSLQILDYNLYHCFCWCSFLAWIVQTVCVDWRIAPWPSLAVPGWLVWLERGRITLDMWDAEYLESAGPESVRMKVSAEFNGEPGFWLAII